MMQAVYLITCHEDTDVEGVGAFLYPCFHLRAGSRCVVNAMPGRFTPGKEPWSQSERVRKLSPSLELEPHSSTLSKSLY